MPRAPAHCRDANPRHPDVCTSFEPMSSVHSWIVACPSPAVYARLVPLVLEYPCVPHHREVPSEAMVRKLRGVFVLPFAELSMNPDVATLTTVDVSTSAVLYTTPATLLALGVSWDPAVVA